MTETSGRESVLVRCVLGLTDKADPKTFEIVSEILGCLSDTLPDETSARICLNLESLIDLQRAAKLHNPRGVVKCRIKRTGG